MKFAVPGTADEFEIPDEWWHFAEMDHFERTGDFWVFPERGLSETEVVPIAEVEPPRREAGVVGLNKLRLVPILMAFAAKHSRVEPIEVSTYAVSAPYKYRVRDGYHRYYATLAAGFPCIPVLIR